MTIEKITTAYLAGNFADPDGYEDRLREALASEFPTASILIRRQRGRGATKYKLPTLVYLTPPDPHTESRLASRVDEIAEAVGQR